MSRTIAAAPATRALPPPVPSATPPRPADDAGRVLVERLLPRLVHSIARPGQVLLREAEPAARIFAVEQGRVDLLAVSETGRCCVLDVVRSGEIFGEWALGTAHVSPFGAVVAEETRLLSASASDAQEAVRSDVRLSRALTAIACARTLRFAEFLRDALVLDTSDRILVRLTDLAARYGVAFFGGVRVDVPLTQEDLARMTGCSRETANRAIAALVRSGRLRVSGRRYVLPPAEVPEPSAR